MKNEYARKLKLNKVTLSNLSDNDMHYIKGATIIHHCTESCTIIHICCDPKTNPLGDNQDQEKDQG